MDNVKHCRSFTCRSLANRPATNRIAPANCCRPFQLAITMPSRHRLRRTAPSLGRSKKGQTKIRVGLL